MVEFLIAAALVFLSGNGAAAERAGERDDEIRITRNFAAELNARIAEIPIEDRAWPLYREAILTLEPLPEELYWDEQFDWPAEPGGHRWDEVVAYLDRNERVIELLHAAADRPRMGYPVAPWGGDDAADQGLPPARAEQVVGTGVDAFRLIDTSIAFTTPMRQFARLLITDAGRSLSQGDSERAIRSLRAAMMVGSHCHDTGRLLGSMVGFAVESLALGAFLEALAAAPETFTDAELLSVREDLSRLDPRVSLASTLEFERVIFLDIVQRVYTDDGDGDGNADAEQIASILRAAPFEDFNALRDSWRLARRGRTVEMYDQCQDALRALLKADPWDEEAWNHGDVRRLLDEPGNRRRYPLVSVFLRSMDRVAELPFQSETHVDAAMLAIDAELHRREHGVYPASREAFDQQIQDDWPRDPYDGEPLRYTIRNGIPLIWSIGDDRDDDDARQHRWGRIISPARWREELAEDPELLEQSDGDWVLFPPEFHK